MTPLCLPRFVIRPPSRPSSPQAFLSHLNYRSRRFSGPPETRRLTPQTRSSTAVQPTPRTAREDHSCWEGFRLKRTEHLFFFFWNLFIKGEHPSSVRSLLSSFALVSPSLILLSYRSSNVAAWACPYCTHILSLDPLRLARSVLVPYIQ